MAVESADRSDLDDPLLQESPRASWVSRHRGETFLIGTCLALATVFSLTGGTILYEGLFLASKPISEKSPGKMLRDGLTVKQYSPRLVYVESRELYWHHPGLTRLMDEIDRKCGLDGSPPALPNTAGISTLLISTDIAKCVDELDPDYQIPS